ncbi:hypothetical protein MTR67_030409 [Solanum verrucosum]|uniref:Reverse transcriptase domain-containing protein n=1 Tax=Solanum verrucosum TaxID=315347 RepID=A0AAF0RE05_SOLVR|nr:hypothetical protein MTR67_030409 [Solanum verrucosum]
MINGEQSNDPVAIKDAIVAFYQNLYKEDECWRRNLNILDVQGITLEEQEWLERAFEEEEVLEGIKMCAAGKAPGTEGYTMAFFQAFWDTIKGDLMQTFHRFHSMQKFEKSFNVTFVALIPKKVGVNDLRDFRPICLVLEVYKIRAKQLSERLKKVMSRLINNHQMAFVKGRQIMDAALIASELIDTRIRDDVPGVMCKLDIEKAYGYLNWNYLINTLRQMGFGVRWLKWIEFCIKTTMFSILINGKPAGNGISVLKRQASSTKKALVDFWQLAFSYQVNPLAAVQPLPPATRGSR